MMKATTVHVPGGNLPRFQLRLDMSDEEGMELINALRFYIRTESSPTISVRICDLICRAIQDAIGKPGGNEPMETKP